MARQNLNKYRFSMLQKHLKQENPLLGDVLEMFKKLDRIGRGLGYLEKGGSFALTTSWWPLISALGTYSSGKSSFINYYLKTDLQSTGNQAVDDKFTVVCYSGDDKIQTLPGQALDSDPRFPLYNIGQSIEEAAPGEGRSVDGFLQLKTCSSD
ncbi:MAG: dynamin family protein, partial [Desulfohalobiaceae bacterium]|nr:dynamin family protein [Desulfohalobiaceae bacterium]